MGQEKLTLVPMLIFALLASVLLGCNEQQNNSIIPSDKTISIQRTEPIISKMYYVLSGSLHMKNISGTPQPNDLDYLDYWNITFKGVTDSLVLSYKSANGEMSDVPFRYKFEDGFLKVYNPDKPLWEVIGYGDTSRISFFVDLVVYKDGNKGLLWINLDFCPEITIKDALELDEQDLFATVSDLTLGNISDETDMYSCREKIYWRVIAYVLE